MLSNILDRLKSWLLGAQEEEVVSQAAPAEFGDNLVVKVEVGSRPTRPSGINVLDVICTMFKKKLAVVVEETIVVDLHWIRWLDRHSQMLHKLENLDQ